MYYFGYYSIDETVRKVTGWFNINNNIKLLRINHYFTKSKEEWIARRSIGKADAKDRTKTRGNVEYQVGMGSIVYWNSGEEYVIEHEGVASHPGDNGMMYYAQKIIEQINLDK